MTVIGTVLEKVGSATYQSFIGVCRLFYFAKELP